MSTETTNFKVACDVNVEMLDSTFRHTVVDNISVYDYVLGTVVMKIGNDNNSVTIALDKDDVDQLCTFLKNAYQRVESNVH